MHADVPSDPYWDQFEERFAQETAAIALDNETRLALIERTALIEDRLIMEVVRYLTGGDPERADIFLGAGLLKSLDKTLNVIKLIIDGHDAWNDDRKARCATIRQLVANRNLIAHGWAREVPDTYESTTVFSRRKDTKSQSSQVLNFERANTLMSEAEAATSQLIGDIRSLRKRVTFKDAKPN